MQIAHIPDTWAITKVEQRVYIKDDEGKKRCGVKNRTNGKPCMNAPMENGRCRLHGGAMLQGSEHPSYKDGRHARFYKQLPTRLREIYDGFSNSDELDSLTPNIAILDTRMAELIERLEEGDYGATYQKLRKAFYKADLSLRTKDMESFAEHWRDIQELIETGSKDYSLWQQIVELNERRGRMVERKHNILNKSELTISIVQFTQVLRLIEDAFVEASDKPTAIARRQHFSMKIQSILAADEG
jgi:hypothetical protein